MSWTLYYDGGCNLCHESQLRAERWACRAGQPLTVDVLLSDAAIAKGYAGDAMVLEADSKVYVGVDAWLRLLVVAPWYLRWMAAFRHTAPTRWLAGAVYAAVAKVRYRLFGRRACNVPPAPKRRTKPS